MPLYGRLLHSFICIYQSHFHYLFLLFKIKIIMCIILMCIFYFKIYIVEVRRSRSLGIWCKFNLLCDSCDTHTHTLRVFVNYLIILRDYIEKKTKHLCPNCSNSNWFVISSCFVLCFEASHYIVLTSLKFTSLGLSCFCFPSAGFDLIVKINISASVSLFVSVSISLPFFDRKGPHNGQTGPKFIMILLPPLHKTGDSASPCKASKVVFKQVFHLLNIKWIEAQYPFWKY